MNIKVIMDVHMAKTSGSLLCSFIPWDKYKHDAPSLKCCIKLL